jgi:MFS family permease
LLLAKPFLQSVGAKYSLIAGLLGNLCYVGSFFLSLSFQRQALPIFIIGAILGGIGSGFLWTGQGSYYSLNAIDFSRKADRSVEQINVIFASIFSGLYLGLETLFGIIATGIYVALQSKADWKSVIFGSYAVLASISVALFWRLIIPLGRDDMDIVSNREEADFNETSNHDSDSSLHDDRRMIDDSTALTRSYQDLSLSTSPWNDIMHDLLAVARGLWSIRRLQLITPYQISFGLSSGLMNYYVNGFIVKTYIGDGYIGILAAIATITAALSAFPYTWLANTPSLGKPYIILFSILCFFLNGLLVLVFSNEELGSWAVMVPFFIVHGAARGAWESINKAMVADFFPDSQEREVAFASIYFTSGLAGAFGYFSYHYMSGRAIAALNVTMAVLAGITFSATISTTHTSDMTTISKNSININ